MELRRRLMMQQAGGGGDTPSVYELWYTTTDGQPLVQGGDPFVDNNTLISNTYTDKGVLVYSSAILGLNTRGFINQTKLLTISIPNSVTGFGTYVFSGCSNLTTVIFAEGTIISTITNSMFEGCGNLVQVENLPSSITTIKASAFKDCNKLLMTELPASIETVEMMAFRATKVSMTELPASCVSVGYISFWESDITDIKILNTNQKVASVPGPWEPLAWSFPRGTIIRVPSAFLAEYQADENWNQYTLVGY